MKSEASRLESLWAGQFGDAYLERNIQAGKGRDKFWNAFLKRRRPRRALEIGCNVGGNLQWIAKKMPPASVWGIDVSAKALIELRKRLPGVNAVLAQAKDLPFKDGYFDLTFTAGVLIHQPDESLKVVMREAVRCTSRYLLCLEYFAEKKTEVPYRGEKGALFKRDYGRIYQQLSPKLKLVEKGFMSKAEGWDDVTWWLFEKRG